MSKFKVGDKVKLKSGICYADLNHIDTYTVRNFYDGTLAFDGLNCYYVENNFMLVEHSNAIVDTSNILTPLQAAEAILNEDKLQVYDSDCDKWYTFACGHRNITMEDLKHIKLRLKPKTMVINGVEVPAPLHEKQKEGLLYYPNISTGNVTMTNAGNRYVKLFWATKEDAQQVLDAMLIPFNGLDVPSAKSNKGEK